LRALLQTSPLWGDHLKLKHPFSCLVSGPSGSGKTSFCIRFLQNLKTLCTVADFSGGIVWCYSEISGFPYRQLASTKHVRFHEGVPADFNNIGEKPCLIILDDLLTSAYSKDVCELFTKGSHHRNISVILITQNLFHQGKFCRDISLNAKYIVLKNVRDRKQFSHLARQVLPHDSKGLSDAYLNSTEGPHGYLVLDLSQDTCDRLRFRTCIFPEEAPSLFYVDIGNETHEGKFPHPSRAKTRSAKIT